jgi:prophage tail gpP-like protein
MEATTRAARSGEVEIGVQGWQRLDNGKLWLPNQLVTCKMPSLRVDGDLLISSINYKKSAQSGTTATMKLARPDAFMVETVVKKKDKTGGGSSYSDILG